MATVTEFSAVQSPPTVLAGVATVDNGETATLAVPCGGRAVVRLGVPTITSGTLTFTVTPYPGATARTLKDSQGNTITIPASTGGFVVEIPELSGAYSFTIVCGAAQGAARQFQVQCVGNSPSPFDRAALRTGGTFSGPILAPDGSDAAPAYSFSADPDTGFYRAGSGLIGATINGTLRYLFTDSGLRVLSGMAVADLATAAAIVTFTGVATAVNGLTALNAAPGGPPQLKATGTDTDIDLALIPKGTGNVLFGAHTGSGDVAVSGYVTIKDATGTPRKLAVIT